MSRLWQPPYDWHKHVFFVMETRSLKFSYLVQLDLVFERKVLHIAHA